MRASNVMIISGDKSKLSNDELADRLENNPSEYANEAAARLRKLSTIENKDNDVLRSKLKIVEDALGEARVAVCCTCDKRYICGHGTAKFDPCCIYKDIDNALASIREE